tara:strand:+ start:119 stop:442 length:324 start_codon:yes stop_codon:yes gene_type:complete
MAFKMSGPSLYKGTPLKQETSTYTKSKAEGTYTKKGRSHTPGPVVGSVFDDGNKTKSSRKIGPAESPETIEKNRANVTKTENEKGVFSKESSAASRKLSDSTDYVKT